MARGRSGQICCLPEEEQRPGARQRVEKHASVQNTGDTLRTAAEQDSLALLCAKHYPGVWHKQSQETHLRAQREVAGWEGANCTGGGGGEGVREGL